MQDDTLDSPNILEDDKLKRFDVIMANLPYSVKRWNQAKSKIKNLQQIQFASPRECIATAEAAAS